MPPRKKVEEVAPKKKGDNSPSRADRAASFLESFNKKMKGRAQLKLASAYTLPFMTKRLPTGLLTLDLELRGGFPAGGLSQIIGAKNSGKSWIVWQMIRQLQSMLGDEMRVLMAMTEMRADKTQGRRAGVAVALEPSDIDSLEKARGRNGLPKFTKEEREELRREIGEIHELHGESGEDLYDGIIQAVENNVYHLIVIDSFGSIMSAAEAESESLSEKQYGGAAAINTKFLRKLCALLTMDDSYGNARDVCVIGINQIRDAIGDPHKEYKATGGRALEHAKFVDLLVTSGRPIGYEDSVMAAGGSKNRFFQTGKEVNWKIEKGKAGIHEGGRGSFVYDFRIDSADFYLDTLIAGVTLGIIEQAGAWLGLPNPEKPGEFILRTQGKEAFIKALSDDAVAKSKEGDGNTLMNYIRSQAFKKADVHISYSWDD